MTRRPPAAGSSRSWAWCRFLSVVMTDPTDRSDRRSGRLAGVFPCAPMTPGHAAHDELTQPPGQNSVHRHKHAQPEELLDAAIVYGAGHAVAFRDLRLRRHDQVMLGVNAQPERERHVNLVPRSRARSGQPARWAR